jgi:hypothetical protein
MAGKVNADEGQGVQVPRGLLPIAARRVYEDATGTPVVSPKAGVASVALVIPANAVLLNVKCSAAWRHGTGDLDGSSGDGYAKEDADGWVSLPVAGLQGQTVNIKTDGGGTATWHFYFEVV